MQLVYALSVPLIRVCICAAKPCFLKFQVNKWALEYSFWPGLRVRNEKLMKMSSLCSHLSRSLSHGGLTCGSAVCCLKQHGWTLLPSQKWKWDFLPHCSSASGPFIPQPRFRGVCQRSGISSNALCDYLRATYVISALQEHWHKTGSSTHIYIFVYKCLSMCPILSCAWEAWRLAGGVLESRRVAVHFLQHKCKVCSVQLLCGVPALRSVPSRASGVPQEFCFRRWLSCSLTERSGRVTVCASVGRQRAGQSRPQESGAPSACSRALHAGPGLAAKWCFLRRPRELQERGAGQCCTCSRVPSLRAGEFI